MATFPGPDGASAPWTVGVGYQNAPGFTSLTTSSLNASGLTANTTYKYLDFTGDMRGIQVNNVTFIGCRFLANRVSDAVVAGNFSGSWPNCTGITFSYCTIGSSASNPPVAYGNGNQYCIDQRYMGNVTIDHCDLWGFGEAIQLSSSSQANPTTITNNWIHDSSADGGGTYHVDGILSSNGGSGIQYVTVSGNSITIQPENTNCIGFQVPVSGGSPYSNLTITNNYISGDNTSVDVGTHTGSANTNITFTGNVYGSDYEPNNTFVYNSGGFQGSGSTWHNNTYYVPASSPFSSPSSAWLASGNSGLYWWPGDQMPGNSSQIIGHSTDYGAGMSNIAWHTGATEDPGNTNVTSCAIVIPAGVNPGDVLLVVFAAFNGITAGETMQASSTGTAPVMIGTTQNVSFNSFNVAAAVFRVVATASDPGATITGSLVSADGAKWGAALGAWSGVSNGTPVDISGAATNSGNGSTITCPAETTTIGGDWAVQLVGCALGGSAYTGGTGYSQRESVVDAGSGAGAFIYDSNGSVGAAGSSAGGAVFSNAGNNSWWAGFTVALAPAGGGLMLASLP